MDESFLHYIWKFQYFDKKNLKTECGENLSILRNGTLNDDAGADFQNSRIQIGDINWNGSVEIHIKGKDWYQHRHHEDQSYDNVILHVVWDSKTDVQRSDGTKIPSLTLKDRVDIHLYERYEQLISSTDRILCNSFLPQVSALKIHEAFDKVVVSRLQRKANEVMIRLRKNKMNWEETAYQILAGNFGFKKNRDPFFVLAENLPHNILLKHSDNLVQIEALIFGQAGFLEGSPVDPYHENLKKEFEFLQKKYKLEKVLSRYQWKFLRMRPANFPTLRIAQFSQLIFHFKNLFSLCYHANSVKELAKKLSINSNEYWQKHYDFGKNSKKKLGGIGKSSIDNIIINTCAPLFAAYAIEKDEHDHLDKAIQFLQETKAENNNIIREWKNWGITIGTAFDSQACIELMNNYCKKRRCLDCNIGVNILQKASLQ